MYLLKEGISDVLIMNSQKPKIFISNYPPSKSILELPIGNDTKLKIIFLLYKFIFYCICF